MKLTTGESIIVKQGVKEPDFEKFELSGWQGRVTEIDTDSDTGQTLVTIEWDSKTLKQIPAWYIGQSETDGCDWKKMILYETDVEKTNPRDKKSDVKKTQEKLEDEYHWADMGDEGKRIVKILQGIAPDDEMKCLHRWSEYLDKNLKFPFAAKVEGSDGYGPVKEGDTVSVKSLPHLEDLYGIIAEIRLGRFKYAVPLCDLKVIDKTKPDYQLINDYRVWFANR